MSQAQQEPKGPGEEGGLPILPPSEVLGSPEGGLRAQVAP